MANINIANLHQRDNLDYLDELHNSEINHVIGGAVTIAVPVTESNQQFLDLFHTLNDPNRGPITINFGNSASVSNPVISNPFDKGINPF
ncbi:hypothetical protein NIES2107_50880 [Nostoc carneum NIES-2107]|nr:hypothetical protein NIES2107_50880 [Nostoc carneum NIES-2107]